jgi:hypothetical protein
MQAQFSGIALGNATDYHTRRPDGDPVLWYMAIGGFDPSGV